MSPFFESCTVVQHGQTAPTCLVDSLGPGFNLVNIVQWHRFQLKVKVGQKWHTFSLFLILFLTKQHTFTIAIPENREYQMLMYSIH